MKLSSNNIFFRAFQAPLLAVGLWIGCESAVDAQVPVNVAGSVPGSPTSAAYVPFAGLAADPIDDQQTGHSYSDFIGNANNPDYYVSFDNNGSTSATDGTLAYRFRFADSGGNANNPSMNDAIYVGIDANLDGAIDLFIGYKGGQQESLGFYSPGNDLNTGPSTTSINGTASLTYTITDGVNLDYSPVTNGPTGNDPNATSTDLDGGGDTDYFLTFSIVFQDLVNQLALRGITGVTDQTGLRYIAATSVSGNTLNADLAGVNGGLNSTLTWTQLGAFSGEQLPSGQPVPEASSIFLSIIALLPLLAWRIYRRLRGASPIQQAEATTKRDSTLPAAS